jgi:hypothetical protein
MLINLLQRIYAFLLACVDRDDMPKDLADVASELADDMANEIQHQSKTRGD